MRDQLDEGAHLHPPHSSHAPIHPVLSVESAKGEYICALLLQVERGSNCFWRLSTTHLLPLSKAAEFSLADSCFSFCSFHWRESEHVVINLEEGL